MGGGPSKHSIAVVGLDGAGKSAVVEGMRTSCGASDASDIVPPTSGGVRLVTSTWSGQVWKLWDLSGLPKFRDMWGAFFNAAHGVILVVDCSDTHRLAVVRDAAKAAHAGAPPHVPLLVVANKRQHVALPVPAGVAAAAPPTPPRHLTKEEVERVVQVGALAAAGRAVHVVQANALTGDGLEGAVAWLADKLSHIQGEP